MPVGSVGKWLVLGSLVTALGASGCKEDDNGDDDGPKDSGSVTDSGGGGGTDSGPADAGPKDSGSSADAAMEAGVMCGTPAVACTGHMTALGAVAPGCARDYADAEVCGISSANVLAGADPKFLQKNAPGVASESCAAFYDSKESIPDGGYPDGGMVLMGNGKIDTAVMISGLSIALQYPGCCTKAGFCSGEGSKGKASLAGGAYNDSDNGYGCMESTLFFRNLPAQVQKIPCDTTTGMIMLPASDAGADAGSDAGASDAGADGGNS